MVDARPDGFGAGTIELRVEGHDAKPVTPRRFYCDHGRSIRLLFSGPNVVVFNRPDTLERVISPPRPQFWVTDRENNATIVARVGDTFQIDLPSTLKTHPIDEWVMRKSSSQSMSLEALRGNTILPDRATTSFFLEAIARNGTH